MFNDMMKLRTQFKNLNGEISFINEMLKSAIDYGGDGGGPYCTNPEDLKDKINKWLTYRHIADDFEVYIVEEKFNPRYVQVRPIHKEISPLSDSYKSEYGMAGYRWSYDNIKIKAQEMYIRAMSMIEYANNVVSGKISNNLTDKHLDEINDEISKANAIYERALCMIVNGTGDDSYKTITGSSIGMNFRFNDYNLACIFLNQFSNLLNNGKFVSIAEVWRLYGISNYHIEYEKRGWKGKVKTSIKTSIEGNNKFYYVMIHDEPIDLF